MLGSFTDHYRAWLEGIQETHEREVLVRVLNLGHREVRSSLTDVIDGQVTIDTSADVTRQLNLTLLDPSESIGWEPDTPSSLPNHLQRMIQVVDRRLIPGVGWVGCPVFTGPVTDLDRTGAEVSIVADGKERLALGSLGRNETWAKKRRVVAIIRDLLTLAGEDPARIHLPALDATIPEKLNVTRVDQPWKEAVKLARSVNRVLYYDGRGHVQMRRIPGKASLRIDRRALMSPVTTNPSPLEIKNRWIVLGPKPGGDKKRVRADVRLPVKHPLSAQSLGRNGRPRWLIEQTTNSKIKKHKQARDIAENKRDDQVRGSIARSFDCLPIPHIEEYDLVRVVDPLTGGVDVRVNQASLPLLGGAMSIGTTTRPSLLRRGRHNR